MKRGLRTAYAVPLLLALGLVAALACAPATPQPAPSGGQPEAQGQPQPKSGGLLSLVQTLGDPPSLDTHQESTGATTQSVHPSYDNLLRFDWYEPEKIVPDLAERWELTPDGKTYTFFLRKDVKFHSGDPFVSADVKFTLERVKNPPQGMVSPRRDQFAAVTSIETPDDSTLKILVNRPNPSLLAALAQGVMPVYSKKWVEGGHDPKKEVNGTGPFIFKEWIRGTSVESVKNPNYWQRGRPYLDGIKSFLITDTNTALAAFRTGQVLLHTVPAANLAQIKTEMAEKVDFYESEGEGFTALIPNTRRKPYDDARVRDALNLAMDRQGAIQVLQQGQGVPGAYMKTSGAWGLPQEELAKLPGYGKDKAKDIERAKQLLSEAGVSAPFNVIMITRSLQSYKDISVFYIDQLKKIGINAELRSHETAEAYDIIRKGDYDLVAWSFGYSLEDPDAVYGEFVNCGAPRNWSFLCVKEVDDLFAQQSQVLDNAKRVSLVREMERKALTANKMIISHRGLSTYGLFKYVKGYKPHAATRNNQRFVEVWLDK